MKLVHSLASLMSALSLLQPGLTAQSSTTNSYPQGVGMRLPLLAPLHQPCTDERQGAEVWAACVPGWKAKFDDGITFHPGYGTDSTEASPFRWRSVALSVGNARLPLARASASISKQDRRYSLDYGPVVEHYDIGVRGIEQSFVVVVPPATPGALVIEGEITTALRTDGVPDADGNLLFFDGERRTPLVYGKAIARDAVGRVAAVETSFGNGRIALTLAAEWLASAAFPVTIDPLISWGTVFHAYGTCDSCYLRIRATQVVSRQRPAPLDHLLVLWEVERSSGGGGSDVFAYRTDSAWQSPTLVFSRLGGWASNATAGYTYANTDRWVIAWEHRTSATSPPGLGIYSHHADDLVPNNGVVLTAFNIAGAAGTYTSFRRPAIGGTLSGTYALVVAEALDLNSPYGNSRQIAFFQIFSAFPNWWNLVSHQGILHEDAGEQRLLPSINTLNHDDSDAWMIAWQQRDSFGPDNFEIVGCTKRPSAPPSALVALGTTSPPGERTNTKVNGKSGKFIVSHHLATSGAPEEIRADSVVTVGGNPTILRQATLSVGSPYVDNLDLAFDHTTAGQFALLWLNGSGLCIRRIDWDMQTIETLLEPPHGTLTGAAMTYCPVPRSFQLVYSLSDLSPETCATPPPNSQPYPCIRYYLDVLGRGLAANIVTRSHTSNCADTLRITTTGTPVLGGSITTSFSGGTGGVALCGIGFPPVNTVFTPACGLDCLILGPAPGIGDFSVGGGRTLVIPTAPSLVGARVDFQTAEVSPSGVPACIFLGVPLRLSDIHSAIVGP